VKLLRENGAAESADCREVIFREEFFSPYRGFAKEKVWE
jgi:hypothetical protein